MLSKLKFKVAVLAFSLLSASLILAACGNDTPTTTSTTTANAVATATVATTNTTPTNTTVPANPTVSATTTNPTTAATTTNSVTSTPQQTTAATSATTTSANASNDSTQQIVDSSLFIDDHSNPVQLLRSYYNAINTKQYVRAYSYWGVHAGLAGQGESQPYPQFAQGFANTASVQLFTGDISSDVGAGTTTYEVPVTLKSADTNGSSQTFVGCYYLKQGDPHNYDGVIFEGLILSQAKIQQVAANADTAILMNQSCPDKGTPLGPNTIATFTPPTPSNISANYYLDSRSTPQDVLYSFYNAINTREYARAYSYWHRKATTPTSEPPAYPQFKQGYANTASVQLTIGQVTSNPGASNNYFKLPITIAAKQTDGTTQTFVGCYTVHEVSPGVFGAPPYIPMIIESAKIQQVPAGANTNVLMNQECH